MDEVLFDPEDAAIFERSAVRTVKRTGYQYVNTYPVGGTPKIAARLVMNAPPDMTVDHINGNPLDCRKSNLRLLSKKMNSQNLHSYGISASGYRGVNKCLNKGHVGRWKVTAQGKHLGCFHDKIFAAAIASTWRSLFMPGALS